VANEVRGTALHLDVTAKDAGATIVEHVRARHGTLDIVVHNAGITRDKLFVNLDEDRWDSVLDVNLRSILRMNEAILGEGGLAEAGRMVCLASIAGIAGNRGQTNYGASKAGVIGLVTSTAEQVRGRRITVNAVAPGFIETEMTARVPFATREIGRRMNSLQQGGQPRDVAETIAWLVQPGAAAVTGQVMRVCGQSLLGA
jgi:3-oxoacyl-[acyl-carrier protein] reductase